MSVIKGLRKWSIMFIIIIIGITFRINEMLNGTEFVSLIKGVSIAFMSSNAIEHTKEAIIKKIESKKEDMSDD